MSIDRRVLSKMKKTSLFIILIIVIVLLQYLSVVFLPISPMLSREHSIDLTSALYKSSYCFFGIEMYSEVEGNAFSQIVGDDLNDLNADWRSIGMKPLWFSDYLPQRSFIYAPAQIEEVSAIWDNANLNHDQKLDYVRRVINLWRQQGGTLDVDDEEINMLNEY